MSTRQAERPPAGEPPRKRSITTFGCTIDFQNPYATVEHDESSAALMPDLSDDILSLASAYAAATPQMEPQVNRPTEARFHSHAQALDRHQQHMLEDEQLFQPSTWNQPRVSITPLNDSLQQFSLQDFEDTICVGDANWEEYLRITSPVSDNGHLFVDRRDSVFSVLSTASSEREERPKEDLFPCVATGPAEQEKCSSNVSADEKESTTVGKPKKRTRANPEQLAVLEETFLTNTSPNATIREYLAARLNMSERSVQIWFQNRRAKVKKAAKKAQAKQDEEMIKPLLVNSPHLTFYSPLGLHLSLAAAVGSRPEPHNSTSRMNPIGLGLASRSPGAANGGSVPVFAGTFASHPAGTTIDAPFSGGDLTSPETRSPDFAMKNDADFAMKNGCPLFSCVVLAIGTWTRVSSDGGELYCGYNPSAQTFQYEIIDRGVCFKMEVPFANVSRLELLVHPAPSPLLAASQAGTLGSPGMPQSLGQLVLDVIRPPAFFIMQSYAAVAGLRRAPQFRWARCDDFTEGRQATLSSRHVIKGDARTLMTQLDQLCHLCPEVRKVLVQHHHLPRHHLAQRYQPRPSDQRRYSLQQTVPLQRRRGVLTPLSRQASAPSPLQLQSTPLSGLDVAAPADGEALQYRQQQQQQQQQQQVLYRQQTPLEMPLSR